MPYTHQYNTNELLTVITFELIAKDTHMNMSFVSLISVSFFSASDVEKFAHTTFPSIALFIGPFIGFPRTIPKITLRRYHISFTFIIVAFVWNVSSTKCCHSFERMPFIRRLRKAELNHFKPHEFIYFMGKKSMFHFTLNCFMPITSILYTVFFIMVQQPDL